jgi:triosephosphate isomerase
VLPARTCARWPTSGSTGGAGALRVLYGGSVDQHNAAELVTPADVDGLLVGGASLEAASFAAVISAVADCYRSSARPTRR